MKSIVVALLLLAAVGVAEEYPDFIALMKTTSGAADALRKMDNKTGPQAMRIAERLGSVYEEMIPFWRQRHAEAAVNLSEQGKVAASELASAAYAGDAERADAALKTILGTCKSCHDARREKLADGRYRIK